MTPAQVQAITRSLQDGVAFVVSLVETMCSGEDGAAKKAKAVELVSAALATGERTLELPSMVIAVTTNPVVIGFLIDRAVAEANAMGLFERSSTVARASAPANAPV